jgi:tetratricopeptide (TPR) repeat protein
MDAARSSFQQGDYALALQYVDGALAQMPNDSTLHELRALILFAQGRYSEAAMTMNAVLAVSPGWDWTTMSSFYPNINVYTAQLRALEAYSRSHPGEASPHFLLGYHYLTATHTDAALRQFQQAAALAPRDAVAAQLVQTLTPPAPTTPTETPTAVTPTPTEQEEMPTQEEVETPTTDEAAQARMRGVWTASQPDGTSFKLALNPGSKFTWTYTRGGQSNSMSGDYVLGTRTLLLQDPKGGGVAGLVIPTGDNSFTLRMLGAPAGQGELVFSPHLLARCGPAFFSG